MIRKRAGALLGGLFVVTGATALIAEQAYEKLLETLVGTSTHAAATVLAIYFAGLTLGGWAYRFWRRLHARPLTLYALLELGVGLWSLLLYATFEHLISAFVPFLRLSHGSLPRLQLLRVITAAAWILPPTALMGSTFPAIVDALREQFDNTRRAISAFYALNLLGATAAAAAGPYLVFAAIGVDGALLVTAIDVVVAAVAWRLSRRWLAVGRSPLADAEEPQPAVNGERPTRARLLLIAVSATCGFLFFALEVVWTHLIAAVCGNSVYSFASMLTMVLAGLFIGGVIAAAIAPGTSTVSAAVPGSMFCAGAIVLVLQQIAWPHVPHLFTVWGGGIRTFAGGELLRGAVSGMMLIPPAAILGTIFPLLFRLRDFPPREQGRAAGAMTAANAVGCCAGAMIAAYVLLPAIGSEALLLLVAIGYGVAGAALLMLVGARRERLRGLAIAAAALLLCGLAPQWDRLALTSGENVYFTPAFTRNSALEFFHEDAAGGFTTVARNRSSGMRVLLTNGKFQGNDGGETVAQISIAMIPTLFAPRTDDALVVGLGTGHSAGVVAQEGFGHIDVAEIAPGIVEAARTEFGGVNHAVLDRPNVTLHVEDGRNDLLLRGGQYDLITMELSSIWFAGATNLYSLEFYRLAAAHVRPDGVFQQWMQLHHTTPREIASTLLTVRRAFPYVSLWLVGGQGIIVATKVPQVVRRAGVEAAARAVPPSRPDLMCVALGSRLLSPDDVDRLQHASPGAVINTDRNRWLEYQSPRYNVSRADLQGWNTRIMQRFARPTPVPVAPDALPLLQSSCK